MDHGQKVTGFTGARLYYPPRSDHEYDDYVTGVESDGAWDFTIPVGALSAGRVECNLAFIDGDGETYSRNVVFLVEPAVSGVYDPGDGQQTRLDKIIGTVQDTADTAIDSVSQTADNAVERVNKTASDAVESIGKAEASINESVTDARESAEAAADSAQQASASASAAQTSERNAANSATQASQSATAAKQSEDNAAESARNAAESERNAASSAEQAANIVASVSGSVTQAAQSATAAAQSASDAQNAVDGFGLQVGTTTTSNPGSDAAVNITKQGTKYVADFTIPKGPQGPKGDPGNLTTVTHNNTLIGGGTSGDPLGVNPYITLNNGIDFNTVKKFGIYLKQWANTATNTPITDKMTQYLLLVNNSSYRDNGDVIQVIVPIGGEHGATNIYFRYRPSYTPNWSNWRRLLTDADDLSKYVPLSTYKALEARVQALEAKSANQ